jgi:hypothetical protein
MTASATIETVPARYGKAIRVPAGARRVYVVGA